jgi:hypothetical protein
LNSVELIDVQKPSSLATTKPINHLTHRDIVEQFVSLPLSHLTESSFLPSGKLFKSLILSTQFEYFLQLNLWHGAQDQDLHLLKILKLLSTPWIEL